MKTEIIAYLAGIVDGEGCIRVKKSKAYKCQERVTPGYHASMHIRMVEREAVELLKKHFGGCLYTEKKHSAAGRPLHCWSISDRQAGEAARILLPFLRIKNRQARLLINLREMQQGREAHRTKIVGYRNFPNSHGTIRVIPNMAFSEEYVAKCESLFLACKKLNRVGVAALAA